MVRDMESAVRLVLLWHFHQPAYGLGEEEAPVMPWVRLHALRDYGDMAALLAAHPSIKATVSVSPVLLDQLERFARRVSGPDPYLRIARTVADQLSIEERRFLVEQFLNCRQDTLAGDLPRYRELAALRGDYGSDPVPQLVVDRFDEAALRDIQVLFHLAWSGETLRANPVVRSLITKGQGYTDEDKGKLLSLQDDYLAGVLGSWKSLAGRGQVEFGCGPYYHPILPLLCDPQAAHEALPALPLPPRRFTHAGDALLQLQSGRERFIEIMEIEPSGGWSPEGAVSEAALLAWHQAGFQWTAADEQVLLTSLGERGHGGQHSFQVHTPWRFKDGPVVLFRDRELSNLLEQSYAAWNPDLAASDFVRRLKKISASATQDGRTATVTVALDGENPWGAFNRNGVPLLNALYSALEEEGIPTLAAAEVAGQADIPDLSRLTAGSWVDGTLRHWIGLPEKNRAWELLAEVRDALSEQGEPRPADEAWRALLAAEGSDWFWWLGGEHPTAFAADFEERFRSLLRCAAESAGVDLPGALNRSIRQDDDAGIMHPAGILNPKLDGFVTDFYEWLAAGRVVGNACVTPTAECMVHELYFGRNMDNLFLRLDTVGPPAETVLAGCMISLEFPGHPEATVAFPHLRAGRSEFGETQVVLGKITELAIPLSLIPDGGRELHFRVVLTSPGGIKQIIPSTGSILLTPDTLANTHSGSWFL